MSSLESTDPGDTPPPIIVDENFPPTQTELAVTDTSSKEDTPGIYKFNDANISICRALQDIFKECVFTLFTESKNILETSFDGGQSRITSEQKQILQSVVNISIRNYTTLWYMANTCENILLEFKRGISPNLASLVVLLSLLTTAAAGSSSTCPTFSNADISAGSVNFHKLMETSEACSRKHTTTVEQRFYLATGSKPNPPAVASSNNTLLSYAFSKSVYESTDTLNHLMDTQMLEEVLQLRARASIRAANNLFSKAKDTITHKFKKASLVSVKKTVQDIHDPAKTTEQSEKVFERITPTPTQKMEAERLMLKTAHANKERVKQVVDQNFAAYKTQLIDTSTYEENKMVYKTLDELFSLDFGVSCQFINDPMRPYASCTYSLIGADVDYKTISQVLETLLEETKLGLKALGVTGIENASSQLFLKIMLVHYTDSNIIELGDFYQSIRSIIGIVAQMDNLVSDGKLFRKIAKDMYTDLSAAPFELLMKDTGVTSLLDKGFNADILFEGIVKDVISYKNQESGIRDAVRDKAALANVLHEVGLVYKDLIGELPTPMSNFLNTTVTTVFEVATKSVTVTGNTACGVLDNFEEFSGLAGQLPVGFAQGLATLQVEVFQQATKGVASIGDAHSSYWDVYGNTTYMVIILTIMMYFGATDIVKKFFIILTDCITGSRNVAEALLRDSKKDYSSFGNEGNIKEIDNQAANRTYDNQQLAIDYGNQGAPPTANQQRRIGNGNQQDANPGNPVPRIERVEISYDQAKAMIEGKGAGKRNNFYTSSVFNNPQETGILSIAKTANELKQIQQGNIVVGTGRNLTKYDGPFYTGGSGTRKHKKRIGAASKHHKKRRRGTKKPSKKRRATRRKRS